MKELEVYAENTRSLMLYMNLHLLGVDDDNANKIASHLGRALGICDVIKKTPYYLAVRRGYIPTEILLKHNLFYDRIWSRVGGESIIADEFFDVLLELGAYARKHVEEARLVASQEELKPHCHRAFLLAQEIDYFLNLLENHNFNIFEQVFRKNSLIKVPYAFYSAAKASKF